MQKTNLNVSPYYDDFSEDSLYHRVLFRPAYSVQARELTQMQTILQNQIERIGSHFFKEGAVVIPGQTGFDVTYSYVKLQATFTVSGVTHTAENFRTDLVGKKLTGATSLVVAKVVNTQAAADSNDLTIFVKYEKSGTAAGGTTNKTFANGEILNIDSAISYTAGGTPYSITAGNQAALTSASAATGTGSSSSVQKGIFYIRGSFVQTSTQTIILDAYSATPSYRVGFTVTESLVTPEEETALLDNATGSTNFAAKGAHRLKYSLTLAKKALGSADDADFIELMSIKEGMVLSQVRGTEYSVLEDTLARRTYDESGDYIVRGFDIDMREHYNDGLNDGVFTNVGGVDGTGDGGDSTKIAIGLSPGKAYVRGYEIGTQGQTFVALNKARSTDFVQNNPTTFSAGNFLSVENVYGSPDITSDGNDSKPFKEIELRDQRMPVTHTNESGHTGATIVVDSTARFPGTGAFYVQIGSEIIRCSGIASDTSITAASATDGVGRGWLGTGVTSHATNSPVYVWGMDHFHTGNNWAGTASYASEGTADANQTANGLLRQTKTVGVARTRAFEVGTTGTTTQTGAHPRTSTFHHYLFDVRMLTKLTITAVSNKGFDATHFLHNGARIKGSSSGATGIVYIAPQDIKFTLAVGSNSSGSANVTVASTAGLEVGMGVSGTNVPTGTYIASITTDVVFVMSQASSGGAASGNLTIGNATDADDGTKINAGTTFHVIQTTGTFTTNDTISCNFSGDLATSGKNPLTATKVYGISDAHSLYGQNAAASGGKEYVADIYPKDAKKLTGTVSASGTTVTGTNTQFTSDLKVGDLFEVGDSLGNVKRMEVFSIISNVSLSTLETFPDAVSNSTITRVRSVFEEQEELVMISKLPKQAVKTLKAAELNNKVDTSLKVRRQNTVTLTGTEGSFSLPDGESFVSFNEDDYVISMVSTANTSNAGFAAGTVFKPSTDGAATCKLAISPQSLGISLSGGFTNDVLKVTYTALIGTANEKTKTLQPMTQLAIPRTQDFADGTTYDNRGIYGTNCTDDEISLMKADVFKVRGVYMSDDFDTPAVAPTMSYTTSAGANALIAGDIFQPGDKITGSNGAIARIINGSVSGGVGQTTQTASFSYLTTKTFTTGTTLTSQQTAVTSFSGTLTISAITAGDENILSNFTFDTGMRDTFYDLGSIARKSGIAPPTGRLLIVFDYFTHGAGNYFSVDSYPVGTSATSIDYSEIPLYSAQRVDPDVISPTGEYDLRDSIDFRPRVGDYDQSKKFNTGSYSTTPFSFAMRSSAVTGANGFESTSASLVDVPKTDDTFQASFNYYLPQNAALWLDADGEFRTIVGAAAENPEMPVPLDDAMQLAEFRIPQYTFSPQDIGMRKVKNRRFTMRDIGKINERVENLEYYSQLNMLEKDTESFQIQDADGLDRFKNGFIVDNFTGHSVGDGMHPDYQNSMDMANGILRPEFKHRMTELEETVSTDSARTSAGYRKTGDLITLPYTETEMVNQPYASRIENVNPFNVIAWVGSIALDPASDIWKDTNRMPNLVINREGNYDSFIARNGGSAVNTVWNEWETFWSGETSNSVQWRDRSWATARKQVPFRRVMERTVTTTVSGQSRQGVRTEITPRIDYESKGDKVVSTEILPYCRARAVNFTCKVFKPMTRLYAFFDNVDVTQYVTPVAPYINKYTTLTTTIEQGDTLTGASGHNVTVGSTALFNSSGTMSFQINDEKFIYTDKNSTTFLNVTRAQSSTSAATHTGGGVTFVYKGAEAGDPLITGATGKCAGVFNIPDPNVSGNPAFKVGERVLRLTSMQDNGILAGDVDTAGEATYYAKGLLDNIQETIIATRNADVNKVTVNESRTVASTRVSDKQVGWWDPVAQSFLIDVKGGAFVTSVNCYFQAKSETVPIQCQIRTMRTGYPTTTILPFGTASVEPNDVQISEDATAPTLFTFPAPVYLQQDIEYCFVIMANTQDYLIWLSHMGDVEVGGTRTISDQPYAGVMFKSQNASTWTAAQMEDLKFSINRASFSLSPGVCTLQNISLPAVSLGQSPIITIPGTKKIKVRHLNHGMYKTNNNVTITGLSGTIAMTSGGNYNLTNANGTYTSLDEIGLDHYILDLAAGGHTGIIAPGQTFAGAKVTGGSVSTATENYMMDTGKITLQIMEVGGTDVTTKIRTTSGTSASTTTGETKPQGGSETPFELVAGSSAVEVSPNENINFATPTMVASTINETNEMTGNKSFEVLATLSTPLENLSPVLDTQRMGIICVQNRLNNIVVDQDHYSSGVLTASDPTAGTIFADSYKPRTAADGDVNAAVYITRKVSLANASTSLKIMFDAIVFSTANLDVYYKVLKSDDTTAFENIEWSEMTIDKVVSESKSYTDFRERTYEVAGLDPFIAFATKIVMRGTRSTEPPFIKDFRAIALAL